MEREMKLELELKEAQNAYGLLYGQKETARKTVLSNAFDGFDAPENTRLTILETSIEFQHFDGRYANTLARLSVDTAYSEDYTQKGYEGGYRFNSGGKEEIKFLPAMADFITIASEKIDVICKLFVDIDLSFGPKMIEARKVRDAIERELREIDNARQQAKKDAILDLMKSDEGFVPVIAKPINGYGWPRSISLTMKWDWEIHSPALIKVVGQSASGKSVKVQVSRKNYDGSLHTYQVETIRMDNLTSFINREVNLRDKVESELEKFEIQQGLLL
jgi:hypothetical protein